MKAHELAYAIERVVAKRMRSLKVPRAKTVAQDLVPEIMEEIPSEAYDEIEAWETGALIFHGDVTEKRIKKLQDYIIGAHANLRPSVTITMYLSSFGGDLFAGMSFASTIQEMRRQNRRVNAHIVGCAMSAASIIAQAADHRSIEPNGWFMLHEISDVINGKTSDLRDQIEYHERLEEQTFTAYSMRTGKPVEYWRKKMHRRDWFLSAAEALAEGLVDEIKSIPPYKRLRRRR
jgi:ATP-dependent protease ClpP protease subunit